MSNSSLDALLPLFNLAMTAALLAVGVYFMTKYLNRKETPPNQSADIELLRSSLDQYVHTFASAIKALQEKTAQISPESRESLLEDIKRELASEVASTAIAEMQSSLEKKIRTETAIAEIEDQHVQTVGRLRQELDSLSKRANLNLSIGIGIALLGLAFLFMNVLQESTYKDFTNFVLNFMPRLSLVVLTELFAYFFLGLYRSSLSEIKYFQNEVTSIETKFLALRVAVKTPEADLRSVIAQLAKIERNFILEKGQSTIELSREKLESDERSKFIAALNDAIKGN
jgi:hypothetical protein